MNAHSSQLGFTDYVAMVWARRSTALTAAGLFACVTFIVFNFVPRRYQATCLFERQGNLISTRTAGLPESFHNLKPLLIQHTTGPDAVRQALIDLGYTDGMPRDAAGRLTPDAAAKLGRMVASTQKNLLFSWIINSKSRDRMSLRLTSGDPVLAYQLPNQLVKNYIAKTREILLEQLAGSAAYLRQRIAEVEAAGAKLAEQRYNFAKGHPDMLPANPEFLTQQIQRLTADLEDLQHRREGLEGRLTILKDIEINGAVETVANPEYVVAIETAKSLENKLETLRTQHTMTDRHPKIIRLSRQIAEAYAEAEAVPQRITATTGGAGTSQTMLRIEDVRAEMDRLAVQQQRKSEQLDRLTNAQANFLPIAREYRRLSAELETAEKEKQMWQDNLVTVERAIAAEESGARTHLEIIRPASPVYRPSWPALWHVFVLAIAGGLSFGVALSIVLNRLSRSFESAEEARGELGLPMLGVIGPILTPAARRIRAIRRYVLAPAAVALLLGVTVLAAAGVVMSTNYPGRYAQIIENMGPTTRAMWQGVQGLLGLI